MVSGSGNPGLPTPSVALVPAYPETTSTVGPPSMLVEHFWTPILGFFHFARPDTCGFGFLLRSLAPLPVSVVFGIVTLVPDGGLMLLSLHFHCSQSRLFPAPDLVLLLVVDCHIDMLSMDSDFVALLLGLLRVGVILVVVFYSCCCCFCGCC